jgi:cell division protein FtsB
VAASRTRERLRRLGLLLGAGVAIWFAIQGGEYGTLDLWRQKRRFDQLTTEIDSLTRVVDSLRRLRLRVLTDARTQERIAREEFGMVRGRELLYRFAEPSDSAAPTRSPESR